MRIGVDLGGTKIEGVLLDDNGSILHRERVETPKGDYEGLLELTHWLVSRLKEAAPHATVGMGTPGAISAKTGRMKNCNNTCLNGKPLKEDLAAMLGCEVRIANDANCFTLSEAIDGSGAGSKSVFGVILGTGTGGGYYVNGSLVAGANAIAGEWGHVRLPVHTYQGFIGQTIAMPVSGKRSCYCGQLDCVETWLSGPGLERTYKEETGLVISAREIAGRFTKGEEAAVQVLNQYSILLAMGLSIVINIVDPETIVLGGGLSNIDKLYEQVPLYLSRYVFSDEVRTRLVKAKHGDSSGVRGAAWLWPKN